jgi:Na+/H+ antiporter NhaD/arsenite permease-like protein
VSGSVVLPAILVVTLVIQAVVPARRLLVVTAGAGLAVLASSLLEVARGPALLAAVPWDVLVILVALGLLSEMIASSGVFGVLAVRVCAWTGANPRLLGIAFVVGMYAMSGLVNNVTALLLVLPMLLVLFKLIGISQRYFTWTVGAVLVACNLGGAATPIGDFPAILLLGRGSMGFNDYLVRALPATLVALGFVMAAVFLVARPERDVERSALSSAVATRFIAELYRNVRPDGRTLAPALAALAAMFVAWSFLPPSLGLGPEVIAWVGVVAALLARPARGERLLRERVDVEATLVLFALFVMVGAVRQSGMFEAIAGWLEALPVSGTSRLVVFLVVAGVLTGIFSAGPSMAALLEVAEHLARTEPPGVVYVGLALSVCAGSSLFLTAATSGPLAQALTERAGLADPSGRPLRFGFAEFVPVGLCSFALIESVAIGYALLGTALR